MEDELKRDIEDFLNEYSKAKNADWFTWIEEAVVLLGKTIEE